MYLQSEFTEWNIHRDEWATLCAQNMLFITLKKKLGHFVSSLPQNVAGNRSRA